jgi:Protein of unknown function (DUF2971)
MIEPHREMTHPPDDAVMWRFMDFTKYVSLLETGRLFFPQAKTMDDNYEGLLPKMTMELRRNAIEELSVSPVAKEHLQTHSNFPSLMARETCYISCWHQNPHESAAMWKLYAPSGEGVAVRTSFQHLKSAFSATKDLLFAAVVNYIDYTKEVFGTHNAFIPILHKRKSFSHEAEVRLIWWAVVNGPSCTWLPGSPSPSPYPSGQCVAVSVAELLQEVFVSPTAGPWLRDLVESITRKYGISCPVRRSDLYSDPVW